MHATAGERLQIELQRCLDSFDTQVSEWRSRVGKREWGRHYSQVFAATSMLEGMRRAITPLLVTDTARVEPLVLSAWRVWEAFRSRLSQRQENLFQTGLQAADEVAWACRKPFSEVVDLPKESALCYLNGSVSPSALVRGAPFAEEAVRGEMVQPEAVVILQSLPVPLISLPWHEVFHAPSMVAITHEAGHVLESDAKLSDVLSNAVLTVTGRYWKSQCAEIFADNIAMRFCGPAFAMFLADALLPMKKRGLKSLDSYPDHDLRMELCHAALEQMNFPTEADALRAQWKDSAGMDISATDKTLIKNVVAALGRMPVGSKTLAEVVTYSSEDEAAVLAIVEQLQQDPAQVKSTSAVHMAAAAARLFHIRPSFFDGQARSQVIQGHMLPKPALNEGVRLGMDGLPEIRRTVRLPGNLLPADAPRATFASQFSMGQELAARLLRGSVSEKPDPSH